MPKPKHRGRDLFVNMVTMGSAIGATIPTTFGQTKCNVLIDTGAMKSCMSQAYYQQLMLPATRSIHSCSIKSANGTNLCPIGITEYEFKIGTKEYKNDFIVCKNLVRPCILGTDFLRKHGIWTGWSPTGKFQLISQQKFLVESLEVLMKGPMIHNRRGINIAGRNLAVISVLLDNKALQENQVYEVKPNLVSGKGIKPLPEKLESVKRMPAPTTPKEIKQFLELVGYYRKFIPRFAAIVVVPKKTEPGEPPRRRLCVDYRVINSLLPEVQKAHSKAKGVLTLIPLPQIDHIYARLRGSQIFSTFDLRSGYHHMELSPEARAKSAFVTPLDKFEFTRCPFGLSQAPAYFQRLMNKVIKGLPFAFVYLDDVLIHSPDIETHLEHIRILFQRLREADLKLKDSKCNYFKTHVQYLGHLVSGKGIKPLPEKLESVKRMPAPTTPKEIKQFLELVGYYRKFIPRFADIDL